METRISRIIGELYFDEEAMIIDTAVYTSLTQAVVLNFCVERTHLDLIFELPFERLLIHLWETNFDFIIWSQGLAPRPEENQGSNIFSTTSNLAEKN